MRQVVFFLALVLTALSLIPAGAHLFALPHKIGMNQTDYFTVQRIYAGWAFLGIFLAGALVFNVALAVVVWWEPGVRGFAVIGALAMALSLAVFFAFTQPANAATANWTMAPENWEALRTQWEYSHAAAAVLDFVGFCAVVLAVIRFGS